MNKKLLIVFGVLAILILLAGVFLKSDKNKTAENTGVSETVTETPKNTESKTLKELLASKVPLVCTYKDTANNSNVEGTNYISGGKVRGDFTTSVNGKVSTGHTIYDGKTGYVWTDESTLGLKVDVDPAEVGSVNDRASTGLQINKSLDYKCSVWLPDPSKFNIPTNINFTTVAVPTGGQATSTQNKQIMCASCNSLVGDQKTRCLTELKCKQ